MSCVAYILEEIERELKFKGSKYRISKGEISLTLSLAYSSKKGVYLLCEVGVGAMYRTLPPRPLILMNII